MLAPGGRLLIRTPGALDWCMRESDYIETTRIAENWKYNFVGANVLVNRLRNAGFETLHYRRIPFGIYALTMNFLRHYLLWKFTLQVDTIVELHRIMSRLSVRFLVNNPYSIVIARRTSAGSSFPHEPVLPVDFQRLSVSACE
jgi:hypothetical protein